LILARCGPHHRAADYGQTTLHEVIARDHGVGVQLATTLLDAGVRLDVRDNLLMSTPLGWACRWGRVELVRLLLARGADSIEPDAQPWATPLAWAERRHHVEIASTWSWPIATVGVRRRWRSRVATRRRTVGELRYTPKQGEDPGGKTSTRWKS
jgi:hypothetical protein